MKRLIALILLCLGITGCTGQNKQLDKAMALRSKLLASGVQFVAEITADYGKEVYQFSMDCQVDASGKLTFTVLAPESISGIAGELSASGGALKFDEQALSFPLLAEGQVTPVAAPWMLIHTLRSGYLTSCGEEGGVVRIAIDDSYAEDALHLDIWLDDQDMPARGEILWKGRRILSVIVKNFQFV